MNGVKIMILTNIQHSVPTFTPYTLMSLENNTKLFIEHHLHCDLGMLVEIKGSFFSDILDKQF